MLALNIIATVCAVYLWADVSLRVFATWAVNAVNGWGVLAYWFALFSAFVLILVAIWS